MKKYSFEEFDEILRDFKKTTGLNVYFGIDDNTEQIVIFTNLIEQNGELVEIFNKKQQKENITNSIENELAFLKKKVFDDFKSPEQRLEQIKQSFEIVENLTKELNKL